MDIVPTPEIETDVTPSESESKKLTEDPAEPAAEVTVTKVVAEPEAPDARAAIRN